MKNNLYEIAPIIVFELVVDFKIFYFALNIATRPKKIFSKLLTENYSVNNQTWLEKVFKSMRFVVL